MRARAWVGIVAAGVVVWSTGGASAADKVSVALNWVPGGDHAAMYYAKKLGWYEKEGLDVSLEPGKGSIGAMQQVATGLSQFALVDMGVAITGRGKGADLVGVFNIYANTALGMYWLKSSGISGVKDFPGKKIGVPPGDAQRALWPALAAKNGVDPNSVTWVNIDPNGKLPALKAKAIDITTNFYNLHEVMSRELGADMGYLAYSKAGVNPYGLTIFVNGGYLKDHKDATARFVRVTQRAYSECVKAPEPCVKALVDSVGALRLDAEMASWKLTMQLMSDKVSRSEGLGYMDPARLKTDYELVKTYLGIATPYDVKEVYTDQFLDPAIKMVEVQGSPFN
jgi:NitT/TauT family transport system substrate-binding protein